MVRQHRALRPCFIVGPHGPSSVNVSASSVVAGFQVIIDGRFWVITEAWPCSWIPASRDGGFLRLETLPRTAVSAQLGEKARRG